MIRRVPADELPNAASAIPVPSLARAILLQMLLFREPLRAWRHRRPTSTPGADRPVWVLPGLGVGDLSTASLRRALRRRGFRVQRWALGRQRPEVWSTMPRALARLEDLVALERQPLALVGWSLGGVVARELARLRPDLVRRVVTLGSPVVGGLRHTAVAGLFAIQGWNLAAVDERVERAARVPIRVPVTAIWSRRDGIVAWQACIDRRTAEVEHLEADSCHWGLGLDPDVIEAVATRLAADGPVGAAQSPISE